MSRFKNTIFCLLFCALPGVGFASSLVPVVFKSKNGVPVYWVSRNNLPMVDIAVVFAAGSARDGDQWGVANLTQNLMGHGTESYTEKEISDAMAETGSLLNSQFSRDLSVWTLRSLTDAKKLRRSVDVFHSILVQPSFPEPIFQRLKDQTRIEILHEDQNPMSLGINAFFSAVYGDQAYGHPPLGTLESIPQLSKGDCEVFYQRYYTAKNAFVVLVGNVNRQQAQQLADTLTRNLSIGEAVERVPLAPVANKKAIFIPQKKAQTTFVMGQVGFSAFDEHHYAELVGNEILGGSGLNSLLPQEVRVKQGLAYSARSQFIPLQGNGPFVMLLQTRTNNAKKAYLTLLQTYQNFLKQGGTDEQLNAAKAGLIGSYELSNVTNQSILNNLITFVFYDYPVNYFETVGKKIEAVTEKEILSAFAPLQTRPLVTVAVGQSNVLETKGH